MVDTKKAIAKTTLGRKLAEYDSKLKLGEEADFIQKLKVSDAKQFGFDSVESYQKELDDLAKSKSHTGKREIDKGYQLAVNAQLGGVCNLINNTTDEVLKTALAEVLATTSKYDSLVIDSTKTKRTDYRKMFCLTFDKEGRLAVFFGGWGDGSSTLRNQYSTRLIPDANSNLDGKVIAEHFEKLLISTSPYNSGQYVPTGKSSGYELKIAPPLEDKITQGLEKAKEKALKKNKKQNK